MVLLVLVLVLAVLLVVVARSPPGPDVRAGRRSL